MSLKSGIKRLFGMGHGTDRCAVVYAPVAGRVVPMHEVRDETFATGILGGGVAILPSGNELRSPADGRIDQVFDSAHAVTLLTREGAELLMHIGIDTVELGGRYFECCVEAGAHVKIGDVLIRFDRQGIADEGYDLTTPLVVGNSEDFDITVAAGETVEAGAPLLELRRKEG